eukprot:c28050_g1_i2 orf=454-2187(-)
MGIIKDGTISGTIPEKCVFAVNYPGYPTSIVRAMETLGGEDGICKARSAESNYLELRFRPEDPFCHPVFGELHRSSGLLLHISRELKQEQETCEITAASEEQTEIKGKTALKSTNYELNADIVARVEQSYEFVGMADYQYVVPVHTDWSRKKQRRSEQFYEKDLVNTEQEEVMILVPPLFSMKDMPEDIVLRPADVARASQNQRMLAEHSWEMDIVPCFNLDFKIKEVPPKVNWEEKLIKGSADWHLQAAICKLFDERPIWSKATLNNQLVEQDIHLTDFQLRRLLFRTAYYFAYGPFRMLWIRNGYDPRKDPESRMHQMVDFRMPKPLRGCSQSLFSEKQHQQRGITWKDIFSFNAVPLKKFSYLQLYDLQDDYIQTQIRRPPERSTCSEYTGWFRRATIERLRRQIRVRFLALLPGDDAKVLLQHELRNLQRLQHLDNIADIGTDASNQQENTSTGDGNAHGNDPNAIDEEEDDKNEEDEDEEEEFDDYDNQELQDEGFGSSERNREACSEPFDSVPKNYLQELLGKFPLSTCSTITMDNQAGLIDLSDEDAEYAIYEQDGGESDDDDDEHDDDS